VTPTLLSAASCDAAARVAKAEHSRPSNHVLFFPSPDECCKAVASGHG